MSVVLNKTKQSLHVRRRRCIIEWRKHGRRNKRAPRRSKGRKRFKKLLNPDSIIKVIVPVYKSKPRYARYIRICNRSE